MLPVFLKTLPFFGLIALGWFAARTRFFPAEAAAWLTKFVFYFALSAMLFRFAAGLDLAALFDLRFVLAYLCGTTIVWLIGIAAARWRGLSMSEAAMEAQCCMIGNVGFLGVPMLVVLLGKPAAGPVLMVLAIDLLVFSTLITLIIHASRNGGLRLRTVIPVLRGIAANPMILSMGAGLLWSQYQIPMPGPLDEFLTILGAAATPGALFAIGASLADRQVQRMAASIWLSAAKLILHPLVVGLMAYFVFTVETYAAGVMVAAAALPVAGNVYMLAQYFGVAQQRVSAAILISTAVSILTVPVVMLIIGQA